MYRKPKVSVITPTHNRAELLKIAMQSVLDCGYENLQFIIVDDASTDDTKQVVADFISKYPDQITYIYNEKNLGESGSINRGWSASQGDYVVTLSDDDFFLPNWFSVSVPFMEENKQIIAGYPDWNKVDAAGKAVTTINMQEYDFIKIFATCANMPGPGVIIRKSLLQNKEFLREAKYIYSADYIMWIVLATIAPLAHIKAVTCSWRQHEKSLTCNPNLIYKVEEMERAIIDFVEQYKHVPIVASNGYKLVVRTYLHIVYALIRGKKFALTAKYALRALCKSPYWLCVLACCYIQRIVCAKLK